MNRGLFEHSRQLAVMRLALVTALMLASLGFYALPRKSTTQAEIISTSAHRLQAAVKVNGPILVLAAELHGNSQSGEVLAEYQGRVLRTIVRGLPSPFTGGIAASPDGRYIAFGEDPAIASHSQQTQGLWIITSTGQGLHRLLMPPPSVAGNHLSVGPIAWSSDGSTLAYAVQISGDVAANPQDEQALGIWLTPFDHARPRLVATLSQLGTDPSNPFITNLSWSSDQHTLVVSTVRPLSKGARPGQTSMVVLAFDIRTRRSRVLVNNAAEGIVSPRAELAYVTQNATGTALWVTDARDRHARKLIHSTQMIVSPTWSPDGHSIAFIKGRFFVGGGTTAIQTVNVTTGRVHTVLVPSNVHQNPLTSGAQFLRLFWMHTRI